MKAYSSAQGTEPVGIVISPRDRSEVTPRWVAWIYAPSPAELEQLHAAEPKAA